jgi:hypothetical protein
MVRLTKALNNIKPLIKKQTDYIKNFHQAEQSSDASSK